MTDITPHYAGNSLEIDVPITAADGTPYPLTGISMTYEAKCLHYGPKAISLTLGHGIEVLAGSTVRVTVPKDTIDIPGMWSHAFTIANAEGFEQTLWKGRIMCAAAP